MASYPVNYAATHGFWVSGTCFPDPKTVTNAPDYRTVYPNAPSDIVYSGHRGLDTASTLRPDMPQLGRNMPLYAVEDGVVIEATNNDGSTSGTFVWAKTGGISITVKVDSIKKHEVCYSLQHMSKRVKNVGDRVYRGELVGYQGNTGVSYGEHCHTTFFLDRKYIDPTPYVFGEPSKLLRLKEVYADPIVVPEVTVVNIKVDARYKYIDTVNQFIRSDASNTASIVGSITPNSEFNVEMIRDNNGFTFGRIPNVGWTALYKGNTAWCVPVVKNDGSAEIERLKTEAEALNAIIARKDSAIANAKTALDKG